MGDLAKGVRAFRKGMREEAAPIDDGSANHDPPKDQKAA
jgi:hypothetical protein